MGKVNIEANEYVQANEVRVEGRVFENFTEPVWVERNGQRFQEMQRKQNTLFSQDVRVSGPTDFGSGPTRSFPFTISMPSYRASHHGGIVENMVKGVIAVKGRPDATGTTMIAFTPPSAYPQMMSPQMQPVGYGPNQGYPGSSPAPAPGYGTPQVNPGYGGPAPTYNMPPQTVTQVVKMRCKYCQTLIDTTTPTCPNCGGHQ